jgi:YMGG-like Gly-zipper
VESKFQITVALLLGLGLVSAVANADDLLIYPAKGQSTEQLEKDRYECHRWAVGQSGFDPSKPQPPSAQAQQYPSNQPTQPHVLKGAARGALVGTVGGAIGGDAGKGAAIGAATGGTVGALRRRDQRLQQQATQQRAASNQANSANSARGRYYRAMSACLQGRGYSVQ